MFNHTLPKFYSVIDKLNFTIICVILNISLIIIYKYYNVFPLLTRHFVNPYSLDILLTPKMLSKRFGNHHSPTSPKHFQTLMGISSNPTTDPIFILINVSFTQSAPICCMSSIKKFIKITFPPLFNLLFFY